MIRYITERERKLLRKKFEKLQREYDATPEEAKIKRIRILKTAESVMKRIEGDK